MIITRQVKIRGFELDNNKSKHAEYPISPRDVIKL